MTQPVTEEMISALIDGELSPADQALVERAIATDESLRQIHESYLRAAEQVRDSARYVQSSISLPADFAQRVMARVMATGAENAAADRSHSGAMENPAPEVQLEKSNLHGGAGDRAWSRRTWLEILAATAALVIIGLVWQSGHAPQPGGGESLAQSQSSTEPAQKSGRSEVRAMGTPAGDDPATSDMAAGQPKEPASGDSSTPRRTSRAFSVFIDAAARPSVDRFWIMNDYEVTAPEGTSPQGDGGSVNVLLIDARKADVIRFLSQLPKWDPAYRLFQHNQAGVASWLAPVDVSQVQDAEGDYWQLQIVLLQR